MASGSPKFSIDANGNAAASPEGENMFRILTFRSERGALWPSPEHSSEAAGRPRGWFGRAIARLFAEYRARRAMQTLAVLDERMLHDIGIHRDQIWYVTRHGREVRRSMDPRPDYSRWS
jgi:uncharacterized protein YjiS (DUF1127 family)